MSTRSSYINPSDISSSIPGRSKGKPTAAIAETIERANASLVNLAAALTTQVLTVVRVTLKKGDVISSATFYSGGTAMATGTNQWAVLLNSSRTVLAVSADDTSTAWAANTAKTFTFGAAYTVPADGDYYVGVMVKATTVPSLIGVSDGYADINALSPVLCATSSTGQTTPPALAATMGAFTAVARKVYATVA